MRLVSNFSLLESNFPNSHILVCVPRDIFKAAELIQLHRKRHGDDFFLFVQGGHNEHRLTLSLCHSLSNASVS